MSRTLRNLSFMVLVALLMGATTGCGKKPDATPSENKPGDTSTPASNSSSEGDLKKLQGVWAVESWDMADEDLKGKDGKVDAKQKAQFDEFKKEFLKSIKESRFQFNGNRMDVFIDERWQLGSFKLDEKSNPKGIILIHLDEKGEPKKIAGKETPNDEAIYKFEGDLLVIALPMGNAASRPKDFKPHPEKFDEKTKTREAPAVAVVTLKKTNDPFKDVTPSKSPTTAPSRGTKGTTSK